MPIAKGFTWWRISQLVNELLWRNREWQKTRFWGIGCHFWSDKNQSVKWCIQKSQTVSNQCTCLWARVGGSGMTVFSLKKVFPSQQVPCPQHLCSFLSKHSFSGENCFKKDLAKTHPRTIHQQAETLGPHLGQHFYCFLYLWILNLWGLFPTVVGQHHNAYIGRDEATCKLASTTVLQKLVCQKLLQML